MLGLDNAGKTTILKKFIGEDINTISPTFGFNIKTVEHKGLKLNIWDVGGQRSLRSYWRNYFESTDGLVWVVDSADHRRLDDCKKELHLLLKEEASCCICKSFHHFPYIIIEISRCHFISLC
jgi:ADP-ribosylation factor-like protein 2